MKHKKIPISYFEIFYKLSECGSFTATAKELGVSKAAISNSMRVLESELKLDLINRTTRSVSLTHEGKILLSYCKSLQGEIDNIRDVVKSFHNKPSGVLRISANFFFAKKMLPKIIRAYAERFPDVRIDLSIEEQMPDFKNDKIDVVFGVNWRPPDDVVARKITETKYVMCASPEYIERKGKLNSLKDLEHHDYIPHKSRGSAVVGLKGNKSVKLNNPKIAANNIDIMKVLVDSGFGIAQFHKYIVEKDIAEGKLVSLLDDEFDNVQDVFIYYQKNKFVQPKIKAFVKVVEELLKL